MEIVFLNTIFTDYFFFTVFTVLKDLNLSIFCSRHHLTSLYHSHYFVNMKSWNLSYK